jgi:hypothetical protein
MKYTVNGKDNRPKNVIIRPFLSGSAVAICEFHFMIPVQHNFCRTQFTLEQVMKAQRGSGCIALLFL